MIWLSMDKNISEKKLTGEERVPTVCWYDFLKCKQDIGLKNEGIKIKHETKEVTNLYHLPSRNRGWHYLAVLSTNYASYV